MKVQRINKVLIMTILLQINPLMCILPQDETKLERGTLPKGSYTGYGDGGHCHQCNWNKEMNELTCDCWIGWDDEYRRTTKQCPAGQGFRNNKGVLECESISVKK